MKRLDAVLSLIDKCGYLADIGCDHGYLSLSVLKSGLADNVCAADISEKSLSKARELLKDYPNAECLLSDGFTRFKKLPDTAVITGMGGREIIKIISPYTVKTLILGAQNHVPLLRKTLCQLKYKITADIIAFENNKFYDIIKAEFSGEITELDEIAAEWGCFYKIKSDILTARLEVEAKKLLSYKNTDENIRKIHNIYEVKKWQQ